MEPKNEKGKKQIMAVSNLSSGVYRGVTIYEASDGFVIALGMMVYSSPVLAAIKDFIDEWYETKSNQHPYKQAEPRQVELPEQKHLGRTL